MVNPPFFTVVKLGLTLLRLLLKVGAMVVLICCFVSPAWPHSVRLAEGLVSQTNTMYMASFTPADLFFCHPISSQLQVMGLLPAILSKK